MFLLVVFPTVGANEVCTLSYPDIHQKAEKHGEIVQITLPQDKYLGRSKGFAFVQFTVCFTSKQESQRC